MGDVLRIRPKSAPYRRAGLAFESADAWVIVDPETLTDLQIAQLGADERLLIEGAANGEAEEPVWEPMPTSARDFLRVQLLHLSAPEPALQPLTGDGTGSALPPLAEVQLIDTLSEAVNGQASDLHRLSIVALTPADVLPELIKRLDAAQVEQEALGQHIDDLKAEKADLAAEIERLRSTHTPEATDTAAGAGDAAGPAQGNDPTAAAALDPGGGLSSTGTGGESGPTPAADKATRKSGGRKAD